MGQNETITLRLPRLFVGQLLDGLAVLIEEWENTAEYHAYGESRDDVPVRECANADEAGKIAAFYREIREEIVRQVG